MTIRNALRSIRNNIGATAIKVGFSLLSDKNQRRFMLAISLGKAFEQECPEAFAAVVDRNASVSVGPEGVAIAERISPEKAAEFAARTVH